MAIRFSLTTLIFLLITACEMGSVDGPKKPKKLLSEEQMIDVLYDFAVLNSAKNINKIVLEKRGIVPVDFVYKKHGIDSTQFIESSAYYTYKSEVIQRIYDSVIGRLERDKTFFEAIYAKEQAKEDSLNKLTAKYRDSVKNLKERELNTMPFKIPPGEMRNKRRLNPKAKDTLAQEY